MTKTEETSSQGFRPSFAELASGAFPRALAQHQAFARDCIVRLPQFLAGQDLRAMRKEAVWSAMANGAVAPRGQSTLVAADAVPAGGLIRRLYESAEFLALIGEVTGERRLARLGDEVADTPLNVMRPGTEMDWHTDFVDISASLLLQAAEDGGEFQTRCSIGGEAIPRPFGEGDLLIFEGRRLQHRITPVLGQTPRIAALFGFVFRADRHLPRTKRLEVFGR